MRGGPETAGPTGWRADVTGEPLAKPAGRGGALSQDIFNHLQTRRRRRGEERVTKGSQPVKKTNSSEWYHTYMSSNKSSVGMRSEVNPLHTDISNQTDSHTLFDASCRVIFNISVPSLFKSSLKWHPPHIATPNTWGGKNKWSQESFQIEMKRDSTSQCTLLFINSDGHNFCTENLCIGNFGTDSTQKTCRSEA